MADAHPSFRRRPESRNGMGTGTQPMAKVPVIPTLLRNENGGRPPVVPAKAGIQKWDGNGNATDGKRSSDSDPRRNDGGQNGNVETLPGQASPGKEFSGKGDAAVYQRIVVPLDGSPISEQALPCVRQLARGLSIPVTLVTVVDASMPGLGHGLNADIHEHETAAHLEEHAASYVNRVAMGLQWEGIDINTVTPHGTPAREIAAEAARTPNALIVMSGHGRSGVARWWLGSVADQTLRLAETPMLIVRSPGEGQPPIQQFSRIVLPVDGSPLAEEIVPYLLPLARGLGLPVAMVRAEPGISDFAHLAAPGIYDHSLENIAESMALRAEEDAHRYLEGLQARLRDQGIENAQLRLVHGDPASAIIDAARDTPGSLVAMTTHGRSGLGRWALGSVADRVARNSSAPVLLIRSRG